MKWFIAIACSAVALIAGGTGYVVAESGGTIAEEGKQAESGVEVEPKQAPMKSAPRAAPIPSTDEKAAIVEAKIEQVQIGASYEEAFAILGAADSAEEQSTDFGHDVIYWYGAWAVYTTDTVVTSVTYYESQA